MPYKDEILMFIKKILKKDPNFINEINNLMSENEIETVFNSIYKKNEWKSKESVSGEGSELTYTENLRKSLPILFSKYNITSLLDAPCGDFNWMNLVIKNSGIKYLGGDIVKDLILENKIKFNYDNVDFIHLDIVNDELPDADLIICRDCLFHLSYDNISKFKNNFLKSNIKYILTTTHKSEIVERNVNINDGEFRLIDLYSPPFNFPQFPLEVIEDWIPGFPERQMVMWSRQQLL